MDTNKQWEEFLTPAITKERLISASIYITAYETLKDSIIERLKDFYSISFTLENSTISIEYQENVLRLNKSPLYASLKWLQNIEAIDQADLKTFEALKELRNQLAHELPLVVFNGKNLALVERMQELMALLRKIEVWWIVNVELATDPQYDEKEVNPDEITPGRVLMMQMMFEVISGNESLREHYRKTASSRRANQP